MAFRSPIWMRLASSLRSGGGGSGGGSSSTFTTSTSPKLKAYAPTADNIHHPNTKPKAKKGAFVPVYVALGMIMLQMTLGLFTATHQLSRNPEVRVKKSKREKVGEVEEPEETLEHADRFLKKSFFRKVARVQDYDLPRGNMSDPIRAEVLGRELRAETLKDVGVHPKSSSPV